MEIIGGVYMIRNIRNSKCYIGSTSNLYLRRRQHFARLRAGRHDSSILQNAFMKYGEGAFVFEVIEVCAEEDVRLLREQHYLDTRKPEYNVSLIANQRTRLGLKSSAEHVARMSASLKGRVGTMKGKRFTAEHRRKIAESMKNRPSRVGWHHTQEAKAKMSTKRRQRR